jgi:hypothetical protein
VLIEPQPRIIVVNDSQPTKGLVAVAIPMELIAASGAPNL